ncbi:MAG: hypothetical protein ABIJ84_01850 [bacterium]
MKDKGKKRMPGDLKPGDQACIKDKKGRRHLAEITSVPDGHVLVWVRIRYTSHKILLTIPRDSLYPI